MGPRSKRVPLPAPCAPVGPGATLRHQGKGGVAILVRNPRLKLSGREGRARRARVGEATREIDDGPLSSRVRGMPTCPWLRRERGQGARRNWLSSEVVRAQRVKAIEPRPLQIVLAPRGGSAPRPNPTLGTARVGR